MKIVFLTQYFPPEIGAPQARLFELARGLKQKGHDISVLTAFPNYPTGKILFGYKLGAYLEEEIEGIKVMRTWIIPSHSRNFLKRLLNYFSFVFSSAFFGLFKLRRQDVLICETPPLFLGISAYLLSKFKKAKLYLYVSDLWPASAVDLGMLKNKLLIYLATKLELFLYRSSSKILVVTEGIKKIIEEYPKAVGKVFTVTNGVDTSFFKPLDKILSRKKLNIPESKFVIIYAGNFGIAQNLETVLKCAKKTIENKDILYVFAGDGVEKQKLIKIKQEHNLSNVIFLGSFIKKEMPLVLSSADISIIPLKKLKLFENALPSKIFEMMSMKIPIILAVKGEAAQIVEKANCGLLIEPEDENSMEKAVIKLYNNRELLLLMGQNGRDHVEKYFSRRNLIELVEGLL